MGIWPGSEGGEVPLGRLVVAMIEDKWVIAVSSRPRVQVVLSR